MDCRKTLPKWTNQVRVSSGGVTEGLEDGYSWRKYGQKEILGARHPRLEISSVSSPVLFVSSKLDNGGFFLLAITKSPPKSSGTHDWHTLAEATTDAATATASDVLRRNKCRDQIRTPASSTSPTEESTLVYRGRNRLRFQNQSCGKAMKTLLRSMKHYCIILASICSQVSGWKPKG